MTLACLILPLIAPADDFAKTWDQVADAIRTQYYARQVRKAEMTSLLDKYGPLAKAARSRKEFEDTVNNMIRDFKDSHFGFFTTSDQSFYLMDDLATGDRAQEMPEFGAWFAQTPSPDGYTVTMVLNGSAAEKGGLRKGDIVSKVNDKPFTPIDSLKPLIGNSGDLTVLRAGQTIHAKVSVSSDRATEMFLEASRESSRVIDDNGRKIGYFHLWTQASMSFRDALASAVYGKLRDTDAFILDIRDGFGGRPEGYGDPFFRPDVWLDWKDSPKSGYRELFGYGRPMVLLINGGSRSAKEVLSYVFKKSHRATLVGQTTAGNVLGTWPQKIGDWAYIEIPKVDVLADGQRLEGKGVSPDVAVPKEFDPNGKDLDLQAALDKLADVPKYRAP